MRRIIPLTTDPSPTIDFTESELEPHLEEPRQVGAPADDRPQIQVPGGSLTVNVSGGVSELERAGRTWIRHPEHDAKHELRKYDRLMFMIHISRVCLASTQR